MGDRVRAAAAVAGRRGHEDAGARGPEEGPLDRVVGSVAARDGVVEDVDAVGDGLVDGCDGVGGGAAVLRRVGSGPAGLVDREARGRRHPRGRAEPLAVHLDAHPVVAGGRRGDVRAVAGAVTGGEVLRARDVLLAEALANQRAETSLSLQSSAVHSSPSAQSPRNPGSCAAVPGVRCGSPVKLGFSGQMPLSTTPTTTPAPARSGPPCCAQAPRGPSRPSSVRELLPTAGLALLVRALVAGPRSTRCLVLRSTSTTPSARADLLDLLAGQRGREAVQRRRVVVEHRRVADRGDQPVLRGPQPVDVGGDGGPVPVEALAVGGTGGGVGGGRRGGQRHDVHPGCGGPERVRGGVRAERDARGSGEQRRTGDERADTPRAARTGEHRSRLSGTGGRDEDVSGAPHRRRGPCALQPEPGHTLMTWQIRQRSSWVSTWT